ncbi:NPC intracellular cholesterol transporter 1-like [Oculina patagonica]
MGRFALVAEILICGVFFLFVTTDTARLWSAPHGTKLYDSKFRKEQLIITSTHPKNTGYHRFPDDKWIPFGPIFHLELLNQALDLQNDITNMKVPFEGSNITLEDICFQPLAPQTKKCAIQSIFQYFQNNKTRLNKCLTSMGFNCSDPDVIDFRAADFHDHLLFCTEYPASPFDERLQEPCLGAFGGPVDPNITLAGFTGTAYKNASTMIITYVVNNYQDESKLAEVMAWEKVFIKYMEAYTNDSSHANLTIKYFTPGSIERLYGIEM